MRFFVWVKKCVTKLNRIIFNKKIFRFIFCLVSILFLVFSPSFIFNKKNYEINLNKYLNLINNQKIILNLWHIETFEGGTNSRVKYLEKKAIDFNKQNPNCFISITKLTEDQLYLNLNQGLSADMYSFGIGAGYMLADKLIELQKNSIIREDLLEYGKINKAIMAYPYILSGYCLISHENLIKSDNSLKTFENITKNKKEIKGVGFAENSFLNPSQVLLSNDYLKINKNNYYSSNTTYEAYCNFVSKKFVSLIGTARDVARCKNREVNGSLSNCKYDFLSGYTDLIQYISVSKNLSSNETKIALQFTDFLISNNCQQDLKNYGLFSVTNISIYEKDYMKNFEIVLNNKLTSVNVFSSLKEIENKKNEAFNLLFS